METLLLYLLKSGIVSGIFYLFYYVVLRRETFFRLNRFYLLGSLIFAYTFPFIRISFNTATKEVFPVIINLQTTINQFTFTEDLPIAEEVLKQTPLLQHYWWLVLLLLISTIFSFRFLKHLFQLRKTIRANEKITQANFTLVLFKQHITFSFFRYIFISQDVWRSPNGNSIINHELSHLKHKHSLDRLVLELMLIAFWMNPFIYLYRKALEEVHEFQADDDATQQTSIKDYFALVLQQSSSQNYSPLMSPFSYKLIKKRIKMANYKSKPLIKLTLIIPVLIGAAILTTSAVKIGSIQSESLDYILIEGENNEELTSSTFIVPINENTLKKVLGWGYRVHPIYKDKRLHGGIDYTAPTNTPVYASQSGTVSMVSKGKLKSGYGKRIELQHDKNYKTVYAHLNGFNIKEGQQVDQGDIIGYVGNTGGSTAPHLHFEIHKNGKKINPEKLLSTTSKSNNTKAEPNTTFSSPISKQNLTKISSGFGMRIHPITKKKKMHNGVDYVAPMSTQILAIGDGTVRKVNQNFEEGKGYGRFIIVDHEHGYSSLYSQLNAYKVKEGQKVKQGDVIGLLGSSGISTGPHLHLEIKKDGHFIDPELIIK